MSEPQLKVLRRRVKDLERDLELRTATGEATESLLRDLRPLVLAAQLEGGIHALRAAVDDHTEADGAWPEFLTARANRLQAKRDGMGPDRG